MAKMKAGRGKLVIGSEVVAEVRSWSDSESPTETDTSVLNNLDGNGDPVARTEAGANNVTLNITVFIDDENTAQALLEVGSAEQTIVLYPDGQVIGRPEYTYANCAVVSRSASGDDINSYVGGEISLKVNGGKTKDVVS